MIEALIERNPGEEPKRVSLDRALRGVDTSTPANFEDMFKLYDFGGYQHFGAKADVIDMNGFLDQLGKRFPMDKRLRESITWNKFLNYSTNPNGYLTCFWNKPTELHHRDIMRFFIGEMVHAIEEYREDVKSERKELRKTPWIRGFGKKRDALKEQASNAESLQLGLMIALDELAEAKVAASTEIGDVARDILRYSQGYLLYSEDPDKARDLWRARLYRVKLESKITKDQKDYGLIPSANETLENIRNFVGSLHGVEFKTNRIHLPTSHKIPVRDVQALSVEGYKVGTRKHASKNRKVDLRVQYDAPLC